MTNNDDKINAIVLVVDDSPESLGILNSALDNAGFTTLVALTGVQALSIIEKIQPDIILLDAVMPELDGFESCKKIKQVMPNVPVIFMTGLTDTENIVKGLEAGGVDYITKPINHKEVIARIKVHLTNARISDSAKATLEITGQNVFSVDNHGTILWSTPQIKNLLASIPNTKSLLKEQLINAITEWSTAEGQSKPIPLVGFEKELTLTHINEQQGEHIVRVEEKQETLSVNLLKEKLPITKREAEVLLWISNGKTNWEVSQILNISPRTVNKHLEQLYKKIDVDNRTAAAALALKTLS